MTQQLDLLRHSDASLIRAHEVAADHALLNPYEPLDARERRAQWHRDEAERIARLNTRSS